MKFSIKYPTCLVGEEPEAGLVKMDSYQSCENCGDRTDFMDVGLLSYLCSDRCRKETIRKYIAFANGET